MWSFFVTSMARYPFSPSPEGGRLLLLGSQVSGTACTQCCFFSPLNSHLTRALRTWPPLLLHPFLRYWKPPSYSSIVREDVPCHKRRAPPAPSLLGPAPTIFPFWNVLLPRGKSLLPFDGLSSTDNVPLPPRRRDLAERPTGKSPEAILKGAFSFGAFFPWGERVPLFIVGKGFQS